MSAPKIQSDKPTSKRNIRLPWLATIVALVAVVIMLRLGYWQIERANTKQERLEQVEKRSGLAALTVDEVLSIDDDVSDFVLQAQGAIEENRYFLLDNRVVNQRVGYEVLVPFRSGAYLMLVNFGWVAAPESREQLPNIDLPRQELRLYGMLSQPTKNPFVSESASEFVEGAMRIQEIDTEQLSMILEEELLPFVMQLSPEHDIGYERNWKPVVMSPQKHWAYAIQWFGLALACMIIALVAIKKKIQRGHFKDE
jgi:cytochrome oxidase assembly protein ShyY1